MRISPNSTSFIHGSRVFRFSCGLGAGNSVKHSLAIVVVYDVLFGILLFWDFYVWKSSSWVVVFYIDGCCHAFWKIFYKVGKRSEPKIGRILLEKNLTPYCHNHSDKTQQLQTLVGWSLLAHLQSHFINRLSTISTLHLLPLPRSAHSRFYDFLERTEFGA